MMRRASFLGAVILAQVTSASVWAAEPGWIADAKSGCKVWNSLPQPSETISWKGPCENGVANGYGTVQWYENGKAGDFYKGYYRDGKENGHGIAIWANGDRYDGQWIGDMMNGHGVYLWANGDRYDGEYLNHKENGRGVLTWAKGGHYEGEFREGKMNGYGVLTKANGDRFEGEFRTGLPNGHGVYATTDGNRYEGDWINGCLHQGSMTVTIIAKTGEQCVP